MINFFLLVFPLDYFTSKIRSWFFSPSPTKKCQESRVYICLPLLIKKIYMFTIVLKTISDLTRRIWFIKSMFVLI